MKKQLLILLILLLSLESFSQYDDNSIVTIKGGYVQKGFAGILEYDYYIAREQFLSGNILITFHTDNVSKMKVDVPYNGIYFDVGYNYQIYQSYQSLILYNLGIGPSLGYQIINNGDKDLKTGALIKSNSKFVLGGYIGADVRIYILRNFYGSINARQYYHPNSDLGKFFPFIGAGFSYTLF